MKQRILMSMGAAFLFLCLALSEYFWMDQDLFFLLISIFFCGLFVGVALGFVRVIFEQQKKGP